MESELLTATLPENISPALGEKLKHLVPGTYCLHRSWGFGQIKEWNKESESVTIDFKSKHGHVMQFAYAAESLTPLSSANGPYSVQTDIPLYPFVWWTGGAQVWMSSKTAGENYTFTFDVSTSGAYHLILAYTLAHDYGIFTQSIDGQTISTPTDGYSSILTLGYRDCGPVQLNAGTHALTLTVIGKNSSAISYGMGLDRIILTEPQTTTDPVIGTALSGQ